MQDPNRTVALLCTLMGKGFGEAGIALQTLQPELIQQRTDRLGGEPPLAQLALQLPPAVLAPRQQAQRGVAFLAQVSASSSGALFAVLGRAFSRMATSICCAISECSFRKLRTLSLP